MKKKRKILLVLLSFLIIVLNIYILTAVKLSKAENSDLFLAIQLESDKEIIVKSYYSSKQSFSRDDVSIGEYDKLGQNKTLYLPISSEIQFLKLVFEGDTSGLIIKNTELYCKGFHIGIPICDAINESIQQGKTSFVDKVEMTKLTKILDEKIDIFSSIINILICCIIDGIFAYILFHFENVMELPFEMIRERKMVATLSKNDFKTRFAGSYLGMMWAFVQPIVTVIVYWFVFEKGLRAGSMCNYPFILWLLCGLVPWFYFADAINGGTNALIEYSYLVKKVVFKISILPFVKVLSNIFIHSFFVIFILILHWCYGFGPSVYWIQILYYIFCTFVLVLGIVYFTSALVVFFRDLTQIISIVLQVGMWATPIMWNPEMFSSRFEWIIKINPVYYIVEGYRNSLLSHDTIGNCQYWTIYFWIFCVVLLLLGQGIFRKLKIHFADVL